MPTNATIAVSGELQSPIELTDELLSKLFIAEVSELYNNVQVKLDRSVAAKLFGPLSGALGHGGKTLLIEGDTSFVIGLLWAIGDSVCVQLNSELDRSIASTELEMRNIAAKIEKLRPMLTSDLHPEGIDSVISDPNYPTNLTEYGNCLRRHHQLSMKLTSLVDPRSTWTVASGAIVGTNLTIAATSSKAN
jgi:hypothetical protein